MIQTMNGLPIFTSSLRDDLTVQWIFVFAHLGAAKKSDDNNTRLPRSGRMMLARPFKVGMKKKSKHAVA